VTGYLLDTNIALLGLTAPERISPEMRREVEIGPVYLSVISYWEVLLKCTSTINQVVSRRFVKKQQMQWSLKGAHLLLQTRTKVLNNELEDVFRRWYPQFREQRAAA